MRFIFCFIFCWYSFSLFAQNHQLQTSGDIHQAIKKLNVLGSALYLAAHPDDENTAVIAYLANHANARTAYLSLTRGDGGQNLIGPEIRELLGVIRTQELLAARRIDGGEQFFSRANDFGFSKHPDETLKIWDKEKILADVVWVIRKFRPDILVNRWSHLSAGKTHGHHTASALLSVEAFELAADPDAFPEQLNYVSVWQPARLYHNVSSRRLDGVDKSKLSVIDAGIYYPLKGKSNNEIAAISRSQHQCQGMGTAQTRGSKNEYLEVIKGDLPENREAVFDGIDISWSRIKGADGIEKMVNDVVKNFNFDQPSESVSALVKIHNKLNTLPESHWRKIKIDELKNIIKACLGLHVEILADDYSATYGSSVELSFEFTNRSSVNIKLERIIAPKIKLDSTLKLTLVENNVEKFYKKIKISKDINYTNPYWINEQASVGVYRVNDQQLRGLPETPAALQVDYFIKIDDALLRYSTDIIHKNTEAVKGDVFRNFEITPPVFTAIQESVYIFPDQNAQEIKVKVKSGKNNVMGKLTLERPDDWRIEPAFINFDLAQKGEEQLCIFKLFPPAKSSEAFIKPRAELSGKFYTKSLHLIDYDHIPIQTVFLPESAKVVKLDIQTKGKRIGYIMGAGDDIPQCLQQIGYVVDLLNESNMQADELNTYDAIIMGVRAYNTKEWLKFHNKKLLAYTKAGGTLIVQYNTGHNLVMPSVEIGPYPFQISRDRITVEDAAIKLLKPDHVLLNHPNKINTNDFNGWVQERGLYFPDEWSSEYDAILSGNDPGETQKSGGLLYTKFGKGHYIYTGYSWFRELPAGVPGAYRIFSNMISTGN